ncbi:cytochrome c oxidase assembly protein subunit 15 [Frigoribacterium sp. PhB160]|uniref:COX15/CtaA family protein n=1 Tax=Frigoribacterium sp. PhB160 TaxID=2485192 RepID=UPI000F4851F0|nr:COX15/CtaA family protein [Frigoribacterium sp. PhB160]ROS62399.1 cytochrome c oxidase assembly protein subunit 15 [Frigoribacterium sp. PhB160]
MSKTDPNATGLLSRAWSWLPTTVDRRVRIVVWASFVCQVLLIGTGGAVRLTGSGLGCPTWPRCTADSFVSTPEMGIHGVIEFGNRLLTFVLTAVVILAFLSVLRMRRVRRELFWLTFAQGMSIPLQAVLGGITVLTGLNPYIVGAHFLVSIVLVALTTTLVYRVLRGPRGHHAATPPGYAVLARVTAVVVLLTVVVGILTTGAGPHAGDAQTPRNGLAPEVMEHVHSWPAYATLLLTVALVAWTVRAGLPRRFPLLLLGVELAQVAVGLLQARTGLPPVLVGTHMVLAALLVAAMTAVLLTLRNDQAEDELEPIVAAAEPALR